MKKNFLRSIQGLALASVLFLTTHADAQVIYISENVFSQTPPFASTGEVNSVTLSGTQNTVTTDFTDTVRSLAFDNSGNLYVLDGNTVKTVSSTGVVATYATIAPNSSANVATDLTFDSSGNLYVAMADIFGGSTAYVAKIAAGNPASITQLGTNLANGASGIAVDSSGNVYISTGLFASTPEIYKITSDGLTTSVFSDSGDGLSGAGDLAFNGSGTLYATEGNGTISAIDSSGEATTFVFGLNSPTLLTYDPNTGNFFITAEDSDFDSVIDEIASDGAVITIPGTIGFAQGIAVGESEPAAVPEPSSWALGALGLLALLVAGRRFRKA